MMLVLSKSKLLSLCSAIKGLFERNPRVFKSATRTRWQVVRELSQRDKQQNSCTTQSGTSDLAQGGTHARMENILQAAVREVGHSRISEMHRLGCQWRPLR